MPTEVRQWEIPADGKVTDRYVHYGEKCRVSINKPLSNVKDDSSVTAKGKRLFGESFGGANANEPCLSMCAFLSPSELSAKSQFDNNGFAMASVVSAQFGNSLLFHFGMADNASAGVRGYHKNAPDGYDFEPNRQKFISYVSDSGDKGNVYGEFLSTKITNEVPTRFTFVDAYTGTDAETDGPYNETFSFTFPMSNKQQYSEAQALIDFEENYFRIEKDSRERILFDYQLFFDSENESLICDLSKCGLISSKRYSRYKLYLSNNSKEKYSKWDTSPKGALISTIPNSHAELTTNSIDFNFGSQTRSYESLAITDEEDNIVFATNATGSTNGTVSVFFAFEKIQPKPL